MMYPADLGLARRCQPDDGLPGFGVSTLWLKNTGRNYWWTFIPFIIIFLTTIGALAYNAYTAFAFNLPNAAALTAKFHITVSQITIANVIIGVVVVVLILTALVMA